MILVSSFAVLLQECAIAMTGPSFENFQIIATGWTFARRRTVTGMLLAAGVAGRRHHAAFHRFFAQARWSLDDVGLAVFRLLEKLCGECIRVAIDDTLARKRGLKMFGAGHAPRPAALQPQPRGHQLGTLLGRAGCDRSASVVAGKTVVSADFVSLVLEQEARPARASCLSHQARVGGGHAAVALPTPAKPAFSRGG